MIAGRKPGAHLTDVQHPWRCIRARAGLDVVRIHDLWHTLASRALALGESLSMIGKLLGHTQVQTTARYAHLAKHSVKVSGSRVGDCIGSQIVPPAAPSRRVSTATRSLLHGLPSLRHAGLGWTDVFRRLRVSTVRFSEAGKRSRSTIEIHLSNKQGPRTPLS